MSVRLVRHDEAALAARDIVVVATPVASHREIVVRHAGELVVCETPRFGAAPEGWGRRMAPGPGFRRVYR